MSTQTITEFLEARVAEDEARASSGWARLGDSRWETTEYGQDFLTPSAVLAECAAKRAIIGQVSAWRHEYNDDDMWYSCPLAVGVDETEPGSGYSGDDEAACRCRLEPRQLLIFAPLAAVYASHPDYQEGWAL